MKEHYVSKRYGNILHIWEPVYRMSFWVCLVKTSKEAKKLATKNGVELDIENNQNGKFEAHIISGVAIGIIWAKDLAIGTLCHECVHAAEWVMEHRGVKKEQIADEPLAYYVGFLIEEILKHAKRKVSIK